MTGFLNLCARRGDRLILDNASIEIPTGTVTGLVAPNGSGKTTLLESICEPWSRHVTCKIDAGNASITRNPSAVEWKKVVFLPVIAIRPESARLRSAEHRICQRLLGIAGRRSEAILPSWY